METVLEFDAHKTRKGIVWFRAVTIESNGARHILSPWQDGTAAAARKIAKREGLRLIQAESI